MRHKIYLHGFYLLAPVLFLFFVQNLIKKLFFRLKNEIIKVLKIYIINQHHTMILDAIFNVKN